MGQMQVVLLAGVRVIWLWQARTKRQGDEGAAAGRLLIPLPIGLVARIRVWLSFPLPVDLVK
jgi:hypothetical protein